MQHLHTEDPNLVQLVHVNNDFLLVICVVFVELLALLQSLLTANFSQTLHVSPSNTHPFLTKPASCSSFKLLNKLNLCSSMNSHDTIDLLPVF